ncbi:hypothetical protein BJY01DRAFT_232972 [Aspergillus pseudoustus]|uniref:Granulins domain-containing protein n=1 Tax=Aspergillus pseudoustus TaxID=1810923 RepID=A0ABR4KFV8_9EURO
MASRTSITSLYRTLLYLLSLPAVSLASGQDILKNHPSAGSSSTYTRNLVSKTFSYGGDILPPTLSPSADSQPAPTDKDEATPLSYALCPAGHKRCANACIPSTQDCCSASTHCFPGDYCFRHDGEVRCCPEGLSCFNISGDVCYAQKVFWYEEVHVHFVEVDVDGEGHEKREEVAVVTEWGMESSVMRTATRVAVTASYPAEGRSVFEKVSRGIVREAETRIVLDEVPTRTRVVTRTVERTSVRASERSADDPP